MKKHPLRKLREERGYTIPELADRAGVHLRTIEDIECSRSKPQQETRRRLLKALRVPLRESDRVFGTELPLGGRYPGELS